MAQSEEILEVLKTWREKVQAYKEDQEDPENLHKLRTYSRRVRALLKKDDPFVKYVKKAMKLSNPIRDIDVFLEEFIPKLKAKEIKALYKKGLFKRIMNEHEQHTFEMIEYLRNVPNIEEVLAFEEQADEPKKGSKKGASKEKKTNAKPELDEAFPEFDQEELHDFRIEIKKLRYYTEAFEPDNANDLKKLAGIQEELGSIHDVGEAIKYLESFVEEGSDLVKDIASRFDEKNQKRYEKAKKIWDELNKNGKNLPVEATELLPAENSLTHNNE